MRPVNAYAVGLAQLAYKKWRKPYYVFCVLLILACFAAHTAALSRVGLITHDDMWFDLEAASVRTEGLSHYWAEAGKMAAGSGRIGYYLSFGLYLAPYAAESSSQRAIIISTVHLLSWVCLAAFIGLYIGAPASLALLALLYCFLPYLWRHFPVVAYPVANHAAILLFFLGMTVYVRAGRLTPGFSRSAARTAAVATIFISLFIYEALTFCFTILVLVLAGRNARSSLKTAWKNWGPVLAALLAYTLIYGSYRFLHPSSYDGTSISAASLFNWRAIASVIFNFTVTALPGANFFYQFDSLRHKGSIYELGIAQFLVANLTLSGALKILGSGAILFGTGLLEFGKATARNAAARAVIIRSAGVIAAVAFAFALLVHLPLALTIKYQPNPMTWAPYVTGYFSFVALIAAAAAALVLFANLLANRAAVFMLALAGVAAAGSGIATLNAVETPAVLTSQEQHFIKWRLMDGLLSSGQAQKVPAGSVIVAPSLYNGIDPGFLSGKYWTEYAMLRGGQRWEVVSAMPGKRGDGARLYYLDIQKTFDGGTAVLLLSEITGKSSEKADAQPLGESVTVLSLEEIKGGALSVLVAPEERFHTGPLELAGKQRGIRFIVPLPAFRRDGRVYLSNAGRPRMITGSAVPVQDGTNLLEQPLVEVIFEQGFSGLERHGARYWHWSDGPSGTGVLNFQNHLDENRSILFRTTVITGTSEPANFDIAFDGRVETIRLADGDILERRLRLRPGRNAVTIRSHGPRVHAPADPRYLVFSLLNWTVETAGEEPARR